MPSKTLIAVTVFLSWSILLTESLLDVCAGGCSCKWKNGKKTVECIGVNLLGIPDKISPETQVFDFSGNLLQLLPSRAFYKVGLINLQKVFASRCGILSIADDALYHLSNLIELDLSNNFITWIPNIALRDTPMLRKLILSSNPIQRVENDSFSLLTHLTVLELSSCQVETVEARAFEGLKSLEYLKLDGNKLRTLPPEMVNPFSTLYGLELHQNPWHCDCRVRSIRKWMLRHNIPISSPPQCFEPPRLREMSWDSVNIDDFACKPQVTVVESTLTFIEGDNATLSCRVHAQPEGSVNWIWRGRVINNLTLMSFGRQMYLIREVGTTLKVNSLTIFNVMLKDSGRYLCVAANPAGRISSNITLNIVTKDGGNYSLSGEEIAGIVIGVIFVIFALFFVFSFFMLRHQRLFPNRSKGNRFTFYKNLLTFNNPVKNTDVTISAATDGKCNTSSGGLNHIVADSMEAENWYPRHSIRETEQGIEMRMVGGDDRVEYRRKDMDSGALWPLSGGKSVQHVFAPDARDSPDEGLGDEREYETDILE